MYLRAEQASQQSKSRLAAAEADLAAAKRADKQLFKQQKRQLLAVLEEAGIKQSELELAAAEEQACRELALEQAEAAEQASSFAWQAASRLAKAEEAAKICKSRAAAEQAVKKAKQQLNMAEKAAAEQQAKLAYIDKQLKQAVRERELAEKNCREIKLLLADFFLLITKKY